MPVKISAWVNRQIFIPMNSHDPTILTLFFVRIERPFAAEMTYCAFKEELPVPVKVMYFKGDETKQVHVWVKQILASKQCENDIILYVSK